MPRRRVNRYAIGARSPRVPPHYYDVTRAQMHPATMTTKQSFTDWITQFTSVMADPRLVSPNLYSALIQDGSISGVDAYDLLFWLDRKLKANKAGIGYTDRLSEAGAGWGDAAPTTLTGADPLGLVATLEGLGWDVVIIDFDGADDGSAVTTDGCVTIRRDSDTGGTAGDIEALDGTNKTTTGLFTAGNRFRYRYWKRLGDFHERGGGGRRCPNVATSKTIFLIRNTAADHVVQNENIIGTSTTQIASLVWMGYPGEFPEIWCGNSAQGGDVTPTQVPDPDDTIGNLGQFMFKNGASGTKYRDNFHVRNIWFHGKRETADGDFIYAGGLFWPSVGTNNSIRFCKFTDFSAITPDDDNALTFPDIVDFAYDVRSAHDPVYKPVYCRQSNFTFDSNYVEFVDIDDWPEDAADTVTVIESANIGLDFGDGVAITGCRFTRNTVKGARYRIAVKFDGSVGAYVAYNNIEHYYEESLVGFSTTGITYEYNRIGFIGNDNLTLTPGLGIGVENSTDAIVRYNVIYSVEPLYSLTHGIAVFASGNSGTPQMVNVHVYGNLLYRVSFKVDGNQQTVGGEPVVPEGLEIYNNLFCNLPEVDKGTRNDAPMYFEIGDVANGYSGVLDYDVSIHDNGFWRFDDSTPTQTTIEAGAHLRIYDSASSSIAYEVDDVLANFTDNLASLPQFLDASEAETNHDFRFAATSPYKEYFDDETPLQSQPRAWTP